LALYSHLSGQGTHLFKECPQLMWETYAKLVRLKKVYRTKDSPASQNRHTANLVQRA